MLKFQNHLVVDFTTKYIYHQTMLNFLIKRLPSAKSKAYSSSRSLRKDRQELALQCFVQGKNKQNQGNQFQALEYYIKATIYNPQYFQAFCNLGACYRSIGKYNQSKNSYLRSLSINPKDAITNYNLANLYRIIGNYQEAIKHYEILIKQQQIQQINLGSLYINALINAGICYKNLGLYQEAIQIYKKVNLLAPDDEGGFYNHAMSILALIQNNTVNKVTNFDRMLASEANQLFDKVQRLNPYNKMVKLARIKLKVLVNRDQQSFKQAFQQLKVLQLESDTQNLTNELNQTLNFCRNLSEGKKNLMQIMPISSKFQQKVTIQQPQLNSSKKLFSQFLDHTEDYLQVEYLTQQKGIQLIEKGRYAELSSLLSNLDDKSKLKHTLLLMLNLENGKYNIKSLDKAYQIYNHFFTKDNGQSIPFDQISTKGHKAIGKLLNLTKNYSEASLHFQYSAQNIKKNEGSSAQHYEIGEGFEQAGNMLQAIEEYHLAFQLQPKNQRISYNLGCCLFQNGHYDEALQYFYIFLQTLQGKNDINEQQRQIWQTQCFILIALASQQGPYQLKLFKEAYSKLKILRKKVGEAQIQEQHLLTFFQNFATILENQVSKQNYQQLQLSELQDLLIEVYGELLSFTNCADREVIILNMGNLAYQSKRYLQAVESFLLIKNTLLLPYQKIALCYLRLIEPLLTLKYIELEVSINKGSKRAHFIKQVIEWIYYNENVGKVNSKLPSVRQDLFFQRSQFGIALIQKFQYQVKTKKIQSTLMISQLIDEILSDPKRIIFPEEYRNAKFEKLQQLLAIQKLQQSLDSSKIITENILQVCFNGSQNIREDLLKILSFIDNIPNFGGLTNVVQALLYTFIYQNKKNSVAINEMLLQRSKCTKKVSTINIATLNNEDQQLLSILPDFDHLRMLVCLLKQWQQALEPKINQILQLVSSIYYRTDISKCFQLQYHFPRYHHFLQCDQTFNKMAYIVLKVLKYDRKININGNKLHEMKKELIQNFQYQFNHHIKHLKLKSIYLSEQFVPLTLHAYHKSKVECQKFINSLLLLGNQSKPFDEDFDQYEIIINNLVRVRCKWGNALSNKSIASRVMRKIVENPLYIVNQSLIQLQQLLQIIKMHCPNAHQILKQDSSLDF